MIPSGFSLLELITVVVIISILVGMGIPLYNRTVERARDQEAKTNLMLMLTAEKMYLAKNGNFYPSSGVVDNITDINSNLWLIFYISYEFFCIFYIR